MSETTPGRELVPGDPEGLARDQAWVERGFWNKVWQTLGRVPFLEEAVAAYFCARDPTTPLQVKAVLIGALAYFVIPTDLIPDFIAALGFADDAAVLYAALKTVAPHITADHRKQGRAALDRLAKRDREAR